MIWYKRDGYYYTFDQLTKVYEIEYRSNPELTFNSFLKLFAKFNDIPHPAQYIDITLLHTNIEL